MRRTRSIAILITLCAVFSFSTEASAYLQDGHALVEAMREFEKAEAGDKSTRYTLAWKYVGYVIGVCDATENEYTLPSNMTGKQVTYVVAKYLKAHPEQWSQPASNLVRQALRAAFPRGW